jgi:hypothetical protein
LATTAREKMSAMVLQRPNDINVEMRYCKEQDKQAVCTSKSFQLKHKIEVIVFIKSMVQVIQESLETNWKHWLNTYGCLDLEEYMIYKSYLHDNTTLKSVVS